MLVSVRARADVDLTFAFGAGVMVGRLPSPDTTESLDLPSRFVPENTRVPMGKRAYTMVGAHMDMLLTIDRTTVVPLLGFGGYTAVGSFDAVATNVDGSVARLKPWKSDRFDVLLPGVGFRFVKRRYAWSALVRTGASIVTTEGDVAAGRDFATFDAARATWLVQAELEACRRLDPVQRVCLFGAPRLYDFGGLTGVQLGLRWEMGR